MTKELEPQMIGYASHDLMKYVVITGKAAQMWAYQPRNGWDGTEWPRCTTCSYNWTVVCDIAVRCTIMWADKPLCSTSRTCNTCTSCSTECIQPYWSNAVYERYNLNLLPAGKIVGSVPAGSKLSFCPLYFPHITIAFTPIQWKQYSECPLYLPWLQCLLIFVKGPATVV